MTEMKSNFRSRSGITLVELAMMVAIMGMLAVMGTETFNEMTLRADQSEAKVILYGIAKNVQIFISSNGRFPNVQTSLLQNLNGGGLLVDFTSQDITTCGDNTLSNTEITQWCTANAGRCSGSPYAWAGAPPSDCADLGFVGYVGSKYNIEFLSLPANNAFTSLFLAGGPDWAAAAVKKKKYGNFTEVFRISSRRHYCAPFNNLSGPAVVGATGNKCEQSYDGVSAYTLWFF